jgi:hypothetical protein
MVNPVSNVKLLQGDLTEAWREGDTEYATVATDVARREIGMRTFRCFFSPLVEEGDRIRKPRRLSPIATVFVSPPMRLPK